jgi:DNA-binding beta-propeller fold protein YncE
MRRIVSLAVLLLGFVPALWGQEPLPTGVEITPTAAPGAIFQTLNPDLAGLPDFVAGQAVTTALSPDGSTLLVLTSGYNRNNGATGSRVASLSNEYVFVFDVTTTPPAKKQVLQVPNTFSGVAWNPSGQEFYVAGGVDDTVHTYRLTGATWTEVLPAVALGHTAGLGIGVRPMAAGLAVTADGQKLVVANYENDSISVVDLTTRVKSGELDLRPGKNDPAEAGMPGGEYPYWVAVKGSSTAYVSSVRDREVAVVSLADPPVTTARIPVSGNPNRMILNTAQTRLYVALDNADAVAVIDTSSNHVVDEFGITAPSAVFPNPQQYRGSNPNGLALSPDEKTLYVTNGGTNAVAVVRLAPERHGSKVEGLIPTGWYPNSVSVSHDGTRLFVVNGKSNTGPNPAACRNTTSIASGSLNGCNAANQYVWQLTKAGFLTVPVPSDKSLDDLTRVVARNNRFAAAQAVGPEQETLSFLRQHIKHVIYIVKENRTYDQVLGDLEVGNGDPSLTIFPESLTPNHHDLARRFVALDNFYDSGEVSGDGWNWSTAARTTDSTEKTVSVNYAGRGLVYDWEGVNRNLNVGLATVAERQAAFPPTPSDPDLLPGAVDVSAPDGPNGEAGTGYLWDAALRAGLAVRNYGFFVDGARYSSSVGDSYIPPIRQPHLTNTVVAFPAKPSLKNVTDPYFRGYDQSMADFWLFKEWEREFDQYVSNMSLPNLQFVRLPHDHFGNFTTAIDGVNTVETQMADNDYAIGLLVEKVAHSPYRDSTLIFIVEDDAQNGGDHVDAHRSIAYVIGPYVKQRAVVSNRYTTVSMLRTIGDILGLRPLGLYDALARPMVDVFDTSGTEWTYDAVIPEPLQTTTLPLGTSVADGAVRRFGPRHARALRDASYWARVMSGMTFEVEDRLDEPRFNRALWEGLRGEGVPYPTERNQRDLRANRRELLERNGVELATSVHED